MDQIKRKSRRMTRKSRRMTNHKNIDTLALVNEYFPALFASQ